MELDNENKRTVLLRESDPFMPILPSPERQEEFLEEGLKTPPPTPIPSPHAFLKEDRWLFSPPPVLTPENTNLDKSETKTDTTPHDTDKDQNFKTLTKKVVRPSSLILPSEEKSPRKRSRTNTVAALLSNTSAKRQDTLQRAFSFFAYFFFYFLTYSRCCLPCLLVFLFVSEACACFGEWL